MQKPASPAKKDPKKPSAKKTQAKRKPVMRHSREGGAKS